MPLKGHIPVVPRLAMGVAQICADQFEQTTYISKGEFPTRGATSEDLRTRAAALRSTSNMTCRAWEMPLGVRGQKE